MRTRRYPIYSEPGRSWMLVFDTQDSSWCVEEISTSPGKRLRIGLAEFERLAMGRRLADRISAAVETAASDAS